MASLNEVTEQLKEATAQLDDANQIITDTRAVIIKVGTETDRLKEQIANLPPVGDAPQELVDALEAIKLTTSRVAENVGAAKSEIGVVDEKVPDTESPTP